MDPVPPDPVPPNRTLPDSTPPDRTSPDLIPPDPVSTEPIPPDPGFGRALVEPACGAAIATLLSDEQ